MACSCRAPGLAAAHPTTQAPPAGGIRASPCHSWWQNLLRLGRRPPHRGPAAPLGPWLQTRQGGHRAAARQRLDPHRQHWLPEVNGCKSGERVSASIVSQWPTVGGGLCAGGSQCGQWRGACVRARARICGSLSCLPLDAWCSCLAIYRLGVWHSKKSRAVTAAQLWSALRLLILTFKYLPESESSPMGHRWQPVQARPTGIWLAGSFPETACHTIL